MFDSENIMQHTIAHFENFYSSIYSYDENNWDLLHGLFLFLRYLI